MIFTTDGMDKEDAHERRRHDYRKKEMVRMSQFVAETSVTNGHLELNNVPFDNNMHVTVIVIPKAELSQMSFPQIWETTQAIKGNLADDIARERDER